ncbi:MAG TPA: hypothetical protein ENO00_00490 [Deltaproteobacteria bacterium]|nr:hypothetical protein [Deltaproteobacteria bacterium]
MKNRFEKKPIHEITLRAVTTTERQKKRRIMWITPDFLKWPAELKRSKTHSDKRTVRHPYQIMHYAEQLLEECDTGSADDEIMATLRRVIDNRLRALDEIYAFDALPVQDKPDDPVERLEYVGVIKSFLCRTLIDIRHGVAPPTFAGYETYLEFVWCFIRVTDGLLVKTPTVIGFPRPAGLDVTLVPYEIAVTVDPRDGWSPKIRGLLDSSMISSEPMAHWIKVKQETIEEKDIPKYASTTMEGDTYHSLYFEGIIRGPDVHLRRLLKIYFSLV